MRLFEELKIRNAEKNRIVTMIRKKSKKVSKEIRNSELRCYDYSNVEDLLEDICDFILDDKHWKKRLGIK